MTKSPATTWPLSLISLIASSTKRSGLLLVESKAIGYTPRYKAQRARLSGCLESEKIGKMVLMRDISLAVEPDSVSAMIALTPAKWVAAYMAAIAVAS